MRLAIAVSPPDSFEGLAGFRIGHTGHLSQAEAPCRCRKEEVLSHLPSYPLLMQPNMMALCIVVKGKSIIYDGICHLVEDMPWNETGRPTLREFSRPS